MAAVVLAVHLLEDLVVDLVAAATLAEVYLLTVDLVTDFALGLDLAVGLVAVNGSAKDWAQFDPALGSAPVTTGLGLGVDCEGIWISEGTCGKESEAIGGVEMGTCSFSTIVLSSWLMTIAGVVLEAVAAEGAGTVFSLLVQDLVVVETFFPIFRAILYAY
jgi:hypothetical protein